MTNRTLTATAVERIRVPATGQADHFDQGYPGLALRVSYGGAKSWVYFYRLFGKQKRLTLDAGPACHCPPPVTLGVTPAPPPTRARTRSISGRPQPTASQRWPTNGSSATKPTAAPAPPPNG